MTKQLSKGTCYFCQGEWSRATMTKHLDRVSRECVKTHLESDRFLVAFGYKRQ
jgi:hypothetical protein